MPELTASELRLRYNQPDPDGGYFVPWIGDRYPEGFLGLKTFVLGESAYDWLDEATGKWRTPNEYHSVASVDAQVEKPQRFFSNIAAAALNVEPAQLTAAQRRFFWDHVAFNNYVQESVGQGSQDNGPTLGQWEAGVKPFERALRILRPDIVWVNGMGKNGTQGEGTWTELPRETDEGPDLPLWRTLAHDRKDVKTCWYELEKGHRILAVEMMHASAPPYHWRDWAYVVALAASVVHLARRKF